jgi:WD40 repeat protein
MANGWALRASIPIVDRNNGRETNAKVINTISTSRVIILRGHSKSVKHITFHPNGNIVTTSASDGSIYVFSISSEDPILVKKLDGIIPALDVDSDSCAKVAWHPDGTCFAAPDTTSRGTSSCPTLIRHQTCRNEVLGNADYLRQGTYASNNRSRMVPKREVPRLLRHRRQSAHLAPKRSNHHDNVVPSPRTNAVTPPYMSLPWHGVQETIP